MTRLCKYRIAWIFAAILIVSAAACAQPNYPELEPVLERFEARLAADVAADSIGAISAGVVVGDKIIWARGFGWADQEKQIAADAETIYRVGSISKSFTAVVLVQLAEKGFLDLDDRVEKYLPVIEHVTNRPEGSEPITLRQLASHTAGLIREPRLPRAAAGPIESWEDKIIASIPTVEFRYHPGERYSYSNIGFGILGLTISRAAGKPFIQLVNELIFKPLRMKSSTFIITPQLEGRLATGYQVRRNGTVDTRSPALEHAGRGYKVPNGGIYSTVGDLARFISAQTGAFRNQILTEDSRAEMQRFQTPVRTTQNGDSTGYGLGFSLRVNPDSLRTVSHGGSVAGYNAHMIFDPGSRIGVVLLRNYSGGAVNLGRAARELLVDLVRIYRVLPGTNIELKLTL
jgi:CubicO group peptidase (beta-lactamase class C family)